MAYLSGQQLEAIELVGRRAGRPHLSDRCAGSHPAPDHYHHSLSPNYHLGRAPAPRAGFNAVIVREAVRGFEIMLISACRGACDSWLEYVHSECDMLCDHHLSVFFLAPVISMRRPRGTGFSGCVLDGLDAEQIPAPHWRQQGCVSLPRDDARGAPKPRWATQNRSLLRCLYSLSATPLLASLSVSWRWSSCSRRGTLRAIPTAPLHLSVRAGDLPQVRR